MVFCWYARLDACVEGDRVFGKWSELRQGYAPGVLGAGVGKREGGSVEFT